MNIFVLKNWHFLIVVENDELPALTRITLFMALIVCFSHDQGW